MVLAGWKTKKDGDKSKKDPGKETEISHLWKTLGFDNFDGGYDLPDDITLQEFVLKQLLKMRQLEAWFLDAQTTSMFQRQLEQPT